jgi:hypothetical protein
MHLGIKDFHVSVNFVYICVGSHNIIWIVGTSLIKHAFFESRRRPGRPNMCLDRFNTVIRWQSRNGMVTRQFRRQINMMRRYEDPPKRLVVHVGANDIGGLLPIKLLRKNLISLTMRKECELKRELSIPISLNAFLRTEANW